MTDQEKTAEKIMLHFFSNCGALIGKKDYEFLVDELSQLLAKYTIE